MLYSRGLAFGILAIATVAVLLPAMGYWSPYTPLGDDASSHITTIATLSRALQTGAGWWSTDYNGGFPMGLYYQPLPHVLSAIVALMFGGASAADETFKGLLVFMLAVQPWAVFAGLRRAGFDRLTAACAGFFAPLVVNGIDFGYNAQASLNIGLYTQAWGNVALPLAFGELAAIGRGKGRMGTGIAACAFVASTHMFYAIALVVPGLAFALLGRRWRTAAWQLPAVGVGAFVTLAAWLIPLATTQAFFGGWPFGRDTRVHGYGWAEVGNKLASGHLMDAEAWPIVTGLALLGTLLAFGELIVRKPGHVRAAGGFALVLAAWALFGVAGRGADGENWLLDLYPLHHTVQLFRYGALLQFTLLILAALGLSRAATYTARFGGTGAAMVLMCAVVLLPLKAGEAQLAHGFRTIDDSTHFRPAAWSGVVNWLLADDTGGRMYIGKRTELRGHYHSGLMAWGARRPAGQSYGVGLHDSLHFYTLEYLRPNQQNALALADIFDFRTVIYRDNADLSGFGDLEPVYSRDGYNVARLDVSGQPVAVMREGARISGNPRSLRQDIRAWMIGNGPATLQTVAVDVPDPRSRDDLIGYPPAPERPMRFAQHPPVGEVLEARQVGSTFNAIVHLDEPGLVVAKLGYHPFWHVELDGEAAESTFVYPGFLAVRADAGDHTVRGWFKWPAYTRVLLFFAPFPIVLGAWLDRRRRNGQSKDEPDSQSNGLNAPSDATTNAPESPTPSPAAAPQ